MKFGYMIVKEIELKNMNKILNKFIIIFYFMLTN